MDISWDDARLFLAVAETGSFSGAARQLNIGQPTVSRRISDMEYRLGWPLFHRGRRGAELTEPATKLVPAARQMARWASELERAVAEGEHDAEGTVRITAPPGMAHDLLVPFTREMKQKLPRIKLQILASVEYVDLLRGQADLAIRTQPTEQPGIVTLAERHFEVAAYGSVAYVESLPAQPSPADIDWIGWAPPLEHVSPNRELAEIIPDFEPGFASDNYLIQMRACALGLGAMLFARVDHPLIDMDHLAEIPLDLGPLESSVYLVCAHNIQYVPRIRAVSKALVKEINAAASPS